MYIFFYVYMKWQVKPTLAQTAMNVHMPRKYVRVDKFSTSSRCDSSQFEQEAIQFQPYCLSWSKEKTSLTPYSS